jgi:diguanylate cyclase (GGDEF)-like protein/PAS domain S-box-containing protein
MFTVLECVTQQHDHLTVLLAAGISLTGMFAFFFLLSRAHECDIRRRRMWTIAASIVGGLSVWATHFVAMLAYEGAVPIGFGVPLTVLSAIIIVAGFAAALSNLSLRSVPADLGRGALLMVAVAVMHFVGMAAIEVAADVAYIIPPIIVGAIVAFALYSAAFYSFQRLGGWKRVAVPALIAILGTCTLHFTAMSATRLVPNPLLASAADAAIGKAWLIGAISVIAYSMVILTVIAVTIDRYLTDLKGFVNSTLDGLAVVRDGRIVEVNAKLARLMNMAETDMIGQRPSMMFATADRTSVEDVREAPVEATPLIGDRDRVFELAVQPVEFRGRPSQVLAVRDLTEKKLAQRKIEHMARHDALTGLPNRTLFRERLDIAVELAAKARGQIALLALDLDRFKAVNDLFGHAEGDRVLKTVADILKRCAANGDTVARLGGDEFVILQAGLEQPAGARQLADSILTAFAEEMNYALDPTAVGVSVGAAIYPTDGEDGETVQHAADMALYRAKTSGRGVAAFFNPEIDRETRERRQMESDLRHAIALDQITLAFQPLLSVDGETVVGYEALPRWHHPEHGLLLPDAFIPIAEETGIIIKLGEWVLSEACKAASGWDSHIAVAVNVSPVQFRLANLASSVARILKETGVDPTRVELEITEAALLKDRTTTLSTLQQLKGMGVRVVMDDFGTGYSSLSNLSSFAFDKIKIDRSFIAAMSNDDGARAIVRAIVGLGRSLGFPVSAEGIETVEQYRMIMDEGCAQVQGLLFGGPGALEAASGKVPTQVMLKPQRVKRSVG